MTDHATDLDPTLDAALRDAGALDVSVPPLPDQLEAELKSLKPATPTRPRTRFLIVGLLSLVYGASLLWVLDLRPDLPGLPATWLVIYCMAWLAGFLTMGWLALVPGPGRIMPNWRHAGVGAALAALGFIAAGLMFDRSVPGVSFVCDATVSDLIEHGKGCLTLGTITALVPIALGSLALRGRVPVGSRWVGAGIGAAGGSLGGLLLHLHCHIADGLHLGIIHGGVVAISALIGALIIPTASRV